MIWTGHSGQTPQAVEFPGLVKTDMLYRDPLTELT
jgi:hypothetical protein